MTLLFVVVSNSFIMLHCFVNSIPCDRSQISEFCHLLKRKSLVGIVVTQVLELDNYFKSSST